MEQSWIVAAGAGALLLVAVIWLLVRRHEIKRGEGETDPAGEGEIRLTEPTLEPGSGSETSEEPVADEAAAALAEAIAESEPPEPDATEPHPVAEDEPDTLPDLDEDDDAPPEAPEPPGASEAPEDSAPEAPEITDPEFLAARDAFEQELLAGHFSKLDVFVAYEQAMNEPGATEIPRSEYFHRVVNAALATRDAFEGLLTDEDRERFVDIHSRYLDDVTVETDGDARERLHREHQEKLAALQPKAAESVTAG